MEIKKNDVESLYSLTPAQKGILFHSMSEPHSGEYVVQTAVMLSGFLNVSALRSAWLSIIERHSVFRTLFLWSELKEPLQVVRQQVDLPWCEYDWTSSDRHDDRLEDFLKQERLQGFDISKAPLLRLALIKVSTEKHWFVWSCHHSIIDGWSLAVVFKEVFLLYQAHSTGSELKLPKPRAFRDFVLWQKHNNADTAAEYWRKNLADFGEPTPLPMTIDAGVRPEEPGAKIREIILSDALSERLRELARSSRTTLNIVVQGIWAVLLSRYSGCFDVLFGVVDSGRAADINGIENMVGPFISTVPVRVSVPDAMPFELWIRQLHATQVERDKYSYSPLVDIQGWSGIPRGTPLFESIVIFENYPISRDLGAGSNEPSSLKITDVRSFEQTNYPLNLFVVPSQRLLLRFMFLPQRCSVLVVERILSHLENIVVQVLDNPQCRVGSLDLFSAQERQMLLHKWNETDTLLDASHTVHVQIETQAEQTPDAIALVFNDCHLTYRDLNRRANRLARYLHDHGVTDASRVGVCVRRSPEMVIAMLAILKAGAAYVPLDTNHPPERLAFMLRDASVSLVLTLMDQDTNYGADVSLLHIDGDLTTSYLLSDENLKVPSALAYVIYTSGSSGKPKGVMVEHCNLVNFFIGMNRSLLDEKNIEHERFTPNWLSVTSISFDISILELLWTLTRGYRVVIYPELHNRGISSLSAQPIDFSLFYFAADGDQQSDKYRLLLDGARFADAHNFDAVWVPERHFHSFGSLYPNPSIAAAAVAAVTKNVGVRAGSVVLPLHDPIRVAEDWSMVDNISGGRVGISFASGWYPKDFVLAPECYRERKQIMLDDINVVHDLWCGKSRKRTDGIGNEAEISIRPRPIQKTLPTWLTIAGNPQAFSQAGEMGVNVLTHLLGQSIQELKHKIELYREALNKHGYDAHHGKVTLMLHTFVGEDVENVRETVRQPFTNYLRNSIDLLTPLAKAIGVDPTKDQDVVLEHGFKRYFDSNALFGTPESCMELISTLKKIGVNEIACLIDFGVETQTTLDALNGLSRLRDMANPRGRVKRLHCEEHAVLSPKNAIETYGITHLQCTPTFAQMLLSEDATTTTISKLHALLVGGESFPPTLAEALLVHLPGRIFNMYGPTETTIWSAVQAVGKPLVTTSTIAGPVANTQLYVLDSYMRPVPYGATGELYIGGDGLARGYVNRPDLTAEKFVPNPYCKKPGSRLYKSGDRVHYLSEGNIAFLGRIDHQVKLRGFRIELGEVENALLSHRAVQQAVVIVNSDVAHGGQLVAYVVRSNPVLSTAELEHYLGELLPAYMIPGTFVFLSTLPLLVSGKVDRLSLPTPDMVGSPRSPYVAPRSTTEEVLVNMWSHMLERSPIGIYDDFFELGGHSLFATQLISRLRQAFNAELPLADIFENPNIASLAVKIDSARDSGQGLIAPPMTPVSRTDKLPLSFAQQRLWFLCQLAPDNPFYNCPFSLRFKGALEVSLLEQCFNEVIKRHESLRTTFTDIAGEPEQNISAELVINITYVDLSESPNVEETIRSRIIEETNRPFDLRNSPLLRAVLIKIGTDHSVLILVMHHIITDGWSMRVMVREVSELYRAYSDGRTPNLPDLAIQYADFSHWQRQWMQDDVIEFHLTYWRQQLEGAPMVLSLPADRQRPKCQTFNGAREFILMSKDLFDAIQGVSRQADVTVFMTLLSVYQVLLRAYSGQDDIIVGTPVANRNRAEMESLIGFFVNMLPIRTRLNINASFKDLLKQVRRTALAAYEHQDLPFDMLVDEMRLERTLEHMPLVQAVFVLHNYPFNEVVIDSGGLTVSPIPINAYQAKFDIAFNVSYTVDSQLLVECEYSTDLFDASTIQRLLTDYQAIMQRISIEPDIRLSSLISVCKDSTQNKYTQTKKPESDISDRLQSIKEKREAKRGRRLS